MNRLSVRLSLAFLLSSWIGIAVMVVIVQRSLNTGFRQYLTAHDNEINPEQATRLESYFATNGSWVGADNVLVGHGNGGGGGASRGATISVANLDGIVEVSTDTKLVNTSISVESMGAIPLTVNDIQVGWLLRQSPGVEALGAAEIAFLDESNRWLTLAGLGATILALLTGSAFAWTLARPLQDLTNGVRDLSVGNLGRQVRTQGTVEVKALAAEFNTMSRALAEAETLRQRMAADVAHELRTPVSVLRGHLEAMLDGVYPVDSAHIAVAHDQTIHLARLVEDLRVLTLAEAKRLPLERTRFHPGVVITQILDAFEPLVLDGNIHLSRQISSNLPDINADVTRIRQVLSNLLTNALRHTPEEGEIIVQVIPILNEVRISVTNTGSEISETDADGIFQPFWRAETARERDKGGSGLGLAISREIITLHGGSIAVQNEPKRVTFVILLPGV